jgi:hypothetical protein
MSADQRDLILADLIRQRDTGELARTTSWQEILTLADQSAEFREVLDVADAEVLFSALGDLARALPEEVERALSPSAAYGAELAHLVLDALAPRLKDVEGWALVERNPIQFVTAVNAISATISTQLGPKAAFGTCVCWDLGGDVTRLADAYRSHVQLRPEPVLSRSALAHEVAYCLELNQVTHEVEAFVAIAFQGCIRLPYFFPDFVRVGVLESDRVELKLLAPSDRIAEVAVRWAQSEWLAQDVVDECVGAEP